ATLSWLRRRRPRPWPLRGASAETDPATSTASPSVRIFRDMLTSFREGGCQTRAATSPSSAVHRARRAIGDVVHLLFEGVNPLSDVFSERIGVRIGGHAGTLEEL